MSDPRPSTWTALLAHWTAMVQASRVLPKGPDGDAWRDSMPAIISLQAIVHALADVSRLSKSEQHVGRDRAGLLIDRHSMELQRIWSKQPAPLAVVSLLGDARRALSASFGPGIEWIVSGERLVAEHPGDLLDELIACGFEGDLYVPAPGVPLFHNSPAAFLRSRSADPDPAPARAVGGFLGRQERPPLVHAPRPAPIPRQVYRQFDFARAGPVRDLVLPLDLPPPAGQPLLVPALIRGQAMPVSLPPRRIDDLDPVPVIEWNNETDSASEAST